MNMPPSPPVVSRWYGLGYSVKFMLTKPRILLWSLILFLVTATITGVVFSVGVNYLDSFVPFFRTAPEHDSFWGAIVYKLWLVGKYLFLIVSRIIIFYLAFLLAYCLTTPGYAFLSAAAERLHAGKNFISEDNISLRIIVRDLIEGLKIGFLGLLVTVAAFVINFIPLIGQACTVVLYIYYSALMFVDFPASRQHWYLGKKIAWVRRNASAAFKIGLLPALLSMIPLANVFLLSLLFPLLTIHATLNFSSIEQTGR